MDTQLHVNEIVATKINKVHFNYFYVHVLKYYSTVYVHERELLKPVLNFVQWPPL